MGKRKWKIETFTRDLYPIIVEQFAEHAALPLRESVILTCSIIDAGIAELLSKRLAGPEHEIVEFLGADEDGRAPCGSFGSRIQLARLLGILTDEDVVLLRFLKKLRNKAAHRVKFDSSDTSVNEILCSIFDLIKPPLQSLRRIILELLRDDPKALKRLQNDPNWGKLKAKLEELKPIYIDLDKKNKDWLRDNKVKGYESMDLIVTWLALYPFWLKKEPKLASFLLAIVLVIYNGRFWLFMKAISPVTKVMLPRETIKMWDSDEVSED
jgi:hypothetical protein